MEHSHKISKGECENMNKSTFARIRNWMYRNSRPLDLMRWQYHFEDGNKNSVLEVLSAYQNEDGGFGHGLEADSWNPNSAPIHTWVATEILRELNITDSNNAIVSGILRYLGSGMDFVNNRWLNTVETNNYFPRAQWWTFEENASSNLDYNPTACLAGFAMRFSDKNSLLYLNSKNIIIEAVKKFIEGEFLNDMHEVSCYIRLMEYLESAKEKEIVDFQAFEKKLIAQVYHLLERDQDKWKKSYICKPTQFFNTPDSIFFKNNECIVEFEIKFILDSINEEGVWDIPWYWTDYQKEFAISENWWKANLVIINLLLMRNFNKLYEVKKFY